jgi:hypothetical protein
MFNSRGERYAAAREDLLQRVLRALSADERVIAAWLSGSEGRGEGDAWADYDLHVAIDNDVYSSGTYRTLTPFPGMLAAIAAA